MIKSQSKRTLCVKLSASIAAVGVLLSAGVASAADATAPMTVGATVAANCTISTGALAFGAYNAVAKTQIDGTGLVNVACTLDEVVDIKLGQGANPDALSLPEAPLRRMELDGVTEAFLSYNLFTLTGRTVVWGDTEATSVSHTGTGEIVGVTVFGRITAGQNALVGSYSDSVLATVTF